VNVRSTPSPADPSATPLAAALDAACLRQALHDLRGPLNNATILLEIVKTLGAGDPALASAKLAQTVRELHRLARMLDQLTVASEGNATSAAPLNLAPLLHTAAAALPGAARVDVVAGTGEPFTSTEAVWAPADAIEHILQLVFERGAAALPEGGTIRVDRSDHPASVRLTFTAAGPRVERPSLPRPRLTDGTRPADDWFSCWALVRRVRGELHVDHGNDVGIRIAIDLPRAAPPRS